jgi:type II secretory pathway pseudopilin PulG
MVKRPIVERTTFNRGDRGFTLLETVIATGLLAGAIAALVQMFAISVANNISARSESYATVLAGQKMEQLRGLTWGFDTLGLPAADLRTDTAAPIDTPDGGTGLSPSPGGTLTANAAGYVDYVDKFGHILGGGETVPARAVYTRRWSIEPLPGHPDTLVLQVFVTKRTNRGSADAAGATPRLPDEARVVSLKTRKAP